jgi:hypothetical protein
MIPDIIKQSLISLTLTMGSGDKLNKARLH